jgi:hypothetical protein
VRRWVEVGVAEEEDFTSLEEGCPAEDDNEAPHKDSPEGFHSNEMQRRSSTHFSRKTNIPNRRNSAKIKCLSGIPSRMSG